jgi:beta-N-acetylglucosaminidase
MRNCYLKHKLGQEREIAMKIRLVNRLLIIAFLINIFLIPTNIYAETISQPLVNVTANVRTGPGTTHPNVMAGARGVQLSAGHKVTILDTKAGTDGYNWYHIQFIYAGVSYQGYMRSDLITIYKYSLDNDDEFVATSKSKGFPDSYLPGLRFLHALYPNWQFEPLMTNLDWQSTVNAQSATGKSLISSSRDVAYFSTEPGAYDWDNDSWKKFDNGDWRAANKEVVAYYLDPRNFLNPYNILMYEELSYNNNYHTTAVVQKILDGTFMANTYVHEGKSKSYASTFIEAAEKTKASPIHLASRVRQEQGTKAGPLVSGNPYPACASYINTYNFFNVNAYGKNLDEVICNGLAYAFREGIFARPWNNIYKSLMGGSEFLASSYINKGQNTMYLQKFNVSPQAFYDVHTHQYMTNIEAPKSEGATAYSSYKDYGILEQPLTFLIPVYDNMPVETTLPTKLGNPNNYLKEIKINNKSIASFNRTTQTYNISIPPASSVTIAAPPISSVATVSGTGLINMPDTNNRVEIKVKAQNGNIRTYTLNITKDDSIPITSEEILYNLKLNINDNFISGINLHTSPQQLKAKIEGTNIVVSAAVKDYNGNSKVSGKIATGDTITINNSKEETTYTVIMPGDVNGDGEITIHDLLIIQKHLLGLNNLKGAFVKAGDINKAGTVTIRDLLKVQKHILGVSLIY